MIPFTDFKTVIMHPPNLPFSRLDQTGLVVCSALTLMLPNSLLRFWETGDLSISYNFQDLSHDDEDIVSLRNPAIPDTQSQVSQIHSREIFLQKISKMLGYYLKSELFLMLEFPVEWNFQIFMGFTLNCCNVGEASAILYFSSLNN